MKKFLLPVLGATVAIFIWSNISWMLLGWHGADFKAFKNESAVADVIRDNISGHGIYIMPDMVSDTSEAGRQKWYDNAVTGPYVFSVIKPSFTMEMPTGILVQLLTQLVGALLLVLVLGRTSEQTVLQTGFTGLIVFSAGAVLSHIPNWNWWAFPTAWTIVYLIDLAIAGFIAGAVAGLVKQKIR